MKDSSLPDLLSNAGAPVAQATQDNVSLIWLQNQAATGKAVAALENFKATGTINVFFQGVEQTLPASQIIDQILSGKDLVKAGLGNPATDSTTPDIVVTLKPGYIWVGNVLSQHKRAEHGGFTDDSTHVALVVSGGALPEAVEGTTVSTPVKTQQVAVSVLEALGLNSDKLTGAVIDHTEALPGLKTDSQGGNKPADRPLQLTAGQPNQAVGASFFDFRTTNDPNGDTVTHGRGDNSGPATGALFINDPSGPGTLDVSGHTSDTAATDHGTVQNVTPSDSTITDTLTAGDTGSGKGDASQSFADEVADLFAMGQDRAGGDGGLTL
jgi:hypothetical protein